MRHRESGMKASAYLGENTDLQRTGTKLKLGLAFDAILGDGLVGLILDMESIHGRGARA